MNPLIEFERHEEGYATLVLIKMLRKVKKFREFQRNFKVSVIPSYMIKTFLVIASNFTIIIVLLTTFDMAEIIRLFTQMM